MFPSFSHKSLPLFISGTAPLFTAKMLAAGGEGTVRYGSGLNLERGFIVTHF